MKDRFGSVAVLWGLFLAALTALGLIAFDVDVETPALLGGAALLMLIAGAALVLARPPLVTVEVAPEISPATAWLAISVALLAASAVLGFWLTLIAAGMCGAGIGAVIREHRAERGLERPPEGKR